MPFNTLKTGGKARITIPLVGKATGSKANPLRPMNGLVKLTQKYFRKIDFSYNFARYLETISPKLPKI
jgi:hypothetical protein